MAPTPMMMPMANPELLVATVSAALQAIQTWLQFRDRRRTAEVAATSYADATESDDTRVEARVLENLVPNDVLATMTARVDQCWKRYQVVISNDEGYLPAEIDNATNAVRECICRELRRIRTLNKRLPAGKLQQYWDQYCVT